MDKPLILDSRWVRPIMDSKEKLVCEQCLKKAARWSVGKPDNSHSCCAHCFLYESPWGKARVDHLHELIAATEKEMGRSISVEGVVHGDDADRILQSIVLISGIGRVRHIRNLPK